MSTGKTKTHLSEFLDVAEFQIRDNEENEGHSNQSHVILPQCPGGALYPQVVQILLSCTSETTQTTAAHLRLFNRSDTFVKC